MIKATGKGPNGRDTLFIGLSFGNLDKFRDGPLDSYIKISGAEMGIPFDVMLFSGRTEADMADLVSKGLMPDAKVVIDDRLKS
jgi:hypothetical protein